jgi:hypothetical protein
MKKRSLGILVVLVVVLVLSFAMAASASAATPYLTSCSPTSASNSTWGSQDFMIYGQNLDEFIGDVDVTLYQRSAPYDVIYATDPFIETLFGGGYVDCYINTYGESAGAYDVEVSGYWLIGQQYPTSIYLNNAFTVTGQSPITTPYIASVQPNTKDAGAAAFQMTVYGNNFPTGVGSTPTVYWNSTALNTTVNSGTQLTAIVPATLVASPATASITVKVTTSTFPSTTVTSNAVAFVVTQAQPTLTSLSPASTWAKLITPPTVVLSGTNFTAQSQVIVNGVARNATFINANQISVALSAADIANPGTLNMAVRNGSLGTPTATLPFTVNAETSLPVVTISGADDAWHNQPVTLTVNATDSQSGIQKVMYLVGNMPFTMLSGNTITVPGPQGGVINGVNTVQVYALDNTNAQSTTAQATVNICTSGPDTEAFAPSSVKKGKTLKISYIANSITPQCNCTLKIYNSSGAVKKTVKLNERNSNQKYSTSFTCNLSPGKYKVALLAVDAAGNQQDSMDKDSFQVTK